MERSTSFGALPLAPTRGSAEAKKISVAIMERIEGTMMAGKDAMRNVRTRPTRERIPIAPKT